MSGIDPIILAAFGPPPEGIDLSVSLMLKYDIVTCIVLGLAAACVALRFYVRTKHNTQMKNLGLDDYSIVVALVSLTFTACASQLHGAGSS
jgi:hypothetical protein